MNGYQGLKRISGDSDWMNCRDIEELYSYGWEMASENIDDDFHTDVVFLRVACGEMEGVIGDKHDRCISAYRGYKGRFYFQKEKGRGLCKGIIERLKRDGEFRRGFDGNIRKAADELWEVFGEMDRSEVAAMDDSDLMKFYKMQLGAQIGLYKHCWPAEVIQIEGCGLGAYLEGILGVEDINKYIEGNFLGNNVKSIYVEEDELLEKIARRIRGEKALTELFHQEMKYLRTMIPWDIYGEIERIKMRYGYLGYHGFGDREAYGMDHYIARIREKLDMEREDGEERGGSIGESPEDELLKLYIDLGASKAYRRLAQLKNFYYLDELLREVAKRRRIRECDLRFMTPEEVIRTIGGNLEPYEMRGIRERHRGMVFIYDRGREYIRDGYEESGMYFKDESGEEKYEFKGSVACSGVARGRACKIERGGDFEEFQDGDIIVSFEADPDLIPLMKRSSGVVTDQGGITCHAAVVAREFGIPCIIGTKEATRFIRDGDDILLDGYGGVVSICNRNKGKRSGV